MTGLRQKSVFKIYEGVIWTLIVPKWNECELLRELRVGERERMHGSSWSSSWEPNDSVSLKRVGRFFEMGETNDMPFDALERLRCKFGPC